MRTDLASLTPEALAALSNVGLVKRAQRELQEGLALEVTEAEDGTVRGSFGDGVECALPPGKSLAEGRCTCGARGACRHRVATALRYAERAAVKTVAPWDLSERELEELFRSRSAAMEALLSRGVEVEVSLAPMAVRFEGCTVRLLAGGDAAHALCDCAQLECAHVGLAFRALRAVPPEDRTRAGLVRLRLGAERSLEALPEGALHAVQSVLEQLLSLGLGDARGLLPRLESARRDARELPWLSGVLEELLEQRAAWELRSALHRPESVWALLAEGLGRIRAARAGGDAGMLLGSGEALEVPLKSARLLSLGTRLRCEGSTRRAQTVFWDGATALSWSVELPEKVDPRDVILLAGAPLGAVATGQVLTRHLTRHAWRTVELRRGRDTQVLPQAGAWSAVKAPTGFASAAELLEAEASLPPGFLRARTATAALRVVATEGARQLRWSPGRQVLSAVLPEGGLRVERAFEWFAPGAVDALAQHLESARYLSGWLRRGPAGPYLEPLALVTERMLVPDLEPPSSRPDLLFAASPEPAAVESLLARVESALERWAHEGVLSARPLRPLAPTLDAYGLRSIAVAWRELEGAHATHDAHRACLAWTELALRSLLLREVSSRAGAGPSSGQ